MTIVTITMMMMMIVVVVVMMMMFLWKMLEMLKVWATNHTNCQMCDSHGARTEEESASINLILAACLSCQLSNSRENFERQ